MLGRPRPLGAALGRGLALSPAGEGKGEKGEVDLLVHGHPVQQRSAGMMLHDVHFFSRSACPCDAVAASDGLLAGLSHDAVQRIAVRRPALSLAVKPESAADTPRNSID